MHSNLGTNWYVRNWREVLQYQKLGSGEREWGWEDCDDVLVSVGSSDFKVHGCSGRFKSLWKDSE